MKTIKRGSTEVLEIKRLQNLLGITADGIFASQTENAVKEFQKNHGLEIDGVVGPMTWAKLTQKPNPVNTTIDIVKGYIHTHITRSPNRPIKYIAIHYTAGGSSKGGTALSTRQVFLSRKASADFVVDDTNIVQINPDLHNYFCWAVGDKKNPYTNGGKLYGVATNINTISIEICSNLSKGVGTDAAKYANHKGWYYTEAALNNALKLVRFLMEKYNIPKNHVVRHYDISGKVCPGVVGWNDAPLYTLDGKLTGTKNNSDAWNNFLQQI